MESILVSVVANERTISFLWNVNIVTNLSHFHVLIFILGAVDILDSKGYTVTRWNCSDDSKGDNIRETVVNKHTNLHLDCR